MIKKPSSLTWIRIAFIISTLFIAALFIYVSIQLRNLIDSFDWVNHTNEVSLSLERLANAASDLEVNQKNFLLTGDSSSLIKRDLASKALTHELTTVNALIKDNPTQRENVKLLQVAINEKLLTINKVVQRNSPFTASRKLKSDVFEGIQKGEIVRQIVSKMAAHEKSLLLQRTIKYSSQAFITRIFIVVLFLGASFMLFASYTRIDRAYHRAKNLEIAVNESSGQLNQALISKKLLEESDQRYRELSQSLEEKVKERTDALQTSTEELQASTEELKANTEELVRMNEALRRSEEKYHRMVAEVQDYAIILLDKNGIVENWNKGAEKIKGYKAEEIIGKSFSNFYSSEAQANQVPQRLLAEAMEKGKSSDENWRIRKDGSKFWGSVVITAIHDHDDNIVGFVKVTRDLTERKLAEEENKVKAQQLEINNMKLEKMNKELQSFAYVSSHDLQEPLRKIQTFASRIFEKEEDSLSEYVKANLKRIQEAAERMRTLINDLLAYSRLHKAEPTFEKTSLREIVNEVKEDLKEELNKKHAIIEVTGLQEVNVIPFQFRQLMDNLIGNSLKYSNPDNRPQIKINTRVGAGAELSNNKLSPLKKYYHIAVVDNGIGFEQQYSEKIFEVFQRLHGKGEYEGTGIGLAIVKKIVENHGGLIAASGEVGKGATFNIYIPA